MIALVVATIVIANSIYDIRKQCKNDAEMNSFFNRQSVSECFESELGRQWTSLRQTFSLRPDIGKGG